MLSLDRTINDNVVVPLTPITDGASDFNCPQTIMLLGDY